MALSSELGKALLTKLGSAVIMQPGGAVSTALSSGVGQALIACGFIVLPDLPVSRQSGMVVSTVQH